MFLHVEPLRGEENSWRHGCSEPVLRQRSENSIRKFNRLVHLCVARSCHKNADASHICICADRDYSVSDVEGNLRCRVVTTNCESIEQVMRQDVDDMKTHGGDGEKMFLFSF